MTGIGFRRHWISVLVALLLLTAMGLTGWGYVQNASAAPLLQTQGIDPITDPKECTSVREPVFINFDDLPAGTHVADQYAPLGVHFVDDSVTTPMIYANIERTTSSPPNSLTNDADLGHTSEGVPLVIEFDALQTVVGFYMGNGTPDITAVITAYGDLGVLGSVTVTPKPGNNVDTFYGVKVPVGAGALIRRVALSYGRVLNSEEIDNLCFSNAPPHELPYTFTGRVLNGGPLDKPFPMPVSMMVSLYGSNDGASLGTPLDSDNSSVDTGAYSLTTNLAFLYYTLVEGPAPQSWCRVKAVPGLGGVALDKERIQYASPPPGLHPGNDFYNTDNKAYCFPPLPPVEPVANLIPFSVALQQVPHYVFTNVDLRGTQIEVSQSIQDNTNSVKQVIEKWTVVRVYVTSGTTTTVNNVLVRLRAYIGGVLKAEAFVRTRAVPSPQRTNVNDSANFYLAVLSGTNQTVEFQADIDPTNEIVETNEGNNNISLTRTFYKRQQIKIAYAPIHYNPSGWGGDEYPTSRIHTAIDWLRSMYPVPNYDARSVVYYPYPGFTFSQNVDTFDYNLISALNTRWTLSHWGLSWIGWLTGVDVGPDSSMLYGWLPDGAYGSNGLSDPTWIGGGSHVAFGNDKLDKYRRTLAHEIGHNLGLCHNNYTINPDIGFDVFLSHAVKDTSFKDVMWPARVESEAWITKLNYGRIFDWLAPGAPMPPGTNPCLTSEMASSDATSPLGGTAPLAATEVITGVHEFAFISGSVDITGTGTLDPIYLDIRNSGDIPPTALESPYCVKLLNQLHEVIDQHCFTPGFTEPLDTIEPRPSAAFSFPMLWNPSTIHIQLLKDAAVLDERTVSKNTPVVTIIAPNGGESFGAGDPIPITWDATDDDVEDKLTFSVFYSPDGGASWLPAASGLTDPNYDLPADSVAGSDNAFVKVLATDGVNTGQDQSDEGFSVKRKAPQVYITDPINGAFFLTGSAVPLNGIGIDLEDGNLDGASLEWTSSLDGLLGTGPSLVKPWLSNGWHTITLRGTDSDDNKTDASIEIFVGDRLFLPLARK